MHPRFPTDEAKAVSITPTAPMPSKTATPRTILKIGMRFSGWLHASRGHLQYRPKCRPTKENQLFNSKFAVIAFRTTCKLRSSQPVLKMQSGFGLGFPAGLGVERSFASLWAQGGVLYLELFCPDVLNFILDSLCSVYRFWALAAASWMLRWTHAKWATCDYDESRVCPCLAMVLCLEPFLWSALECCCFRRCFVRSGVSSLAFTDAESLVGMRIGMRSLADAVSRFQLPKMVLLVFGTGASRIGAVASF
ncbi:hypothetical protein Nepgr_015837 [Nepenthes gracilis]|uniref:Uncharacterized protein n=1 Tax=Nepenthes gracilis TaxID=150966 RepID=A0AAD3XRN7_NEPGR|nr:hypothetical protein Nepgr_015837 [Nepenthes gracilis]